MNKYSKISLFRLTILTLASFLIWNCSDATKNEVSDSRIIQNPEYGSKQNTVPTPFEFVLEDSIFIQLPEDFILSGISFLSTDNNGNFYFMDIAQSKLISVSPDGTLRWITGEKGKGPGDFESVWGISILDSSIMVNNINSSRLDYFDFEGNFIKSTSLGKDVGFSSIVGITKNGNLVMSGPNWDSFGHSILLVKPESDSLIVEHSFKIDESNGVKVTKGFNAKTEIHIIDDNIVTGSIHDYSFSIYDLEGTLLKNIHRDFDRIVRPGMYVSEEFSVLNSFGSTASPFKINNDLYLATANWPTNVSDPDQFTKRAALGSEERVQFMNTIDFFDANWNLLYSKESDGYDSKIGRIQLVKDESIFTARAEPSPTIFRYRILERN